jgi:hypothetical protein
MRRRLVAYAAAAIVLAAMLGPPLRGVDRDSYPLSTYPMFSRDRGPVSRVATAVGLEADDDLHRLDPHLVAGTDEVMLAVQTVSGAVRGGPESTRRLCEQIAGRVAAHPDLDRVVTVVIRVEEHHAVRYFRGERTPRSAEEHGSCRVEQ